MFDTMTTTKIIGALSGTFLIFLLGKWAATSLYDFNEGSNHKEVKNAYVIETDEAPATDEAVEVIDFTALLAAGDIEKGERVFRSCAACHSLDPGANKTGPTLFEVVGRDIGSVDGFGYSSAVSELPGTWTGEELMKFLENPRAYVPGTKMSASVKKINDRADVVAYLSSLGG